MAINYHDGGGKDPYAPDFTNVHVVPADLAAFADLLDDDLRAIQGTWERLRSDMLSQPPPNFPGEHAGEFNYATGHPVHGSSGGIHEAREFRRAYFRTVDAEMKLMEDLIKGLMIIRDAAWEIHDGYVTSDETNATALEDAFAGYEPWRVIDTFRQVRESGPPVTGGEHS